MQQFTIKGYKVTVKDNGSNSNYNKSVTVYKDGQVISGFNWKNESPKEIIPMVENSIKEYENPIEFLW